MSALPQLRPVTVVIVDDTADLRELLRFALERHEFTVVAEAVDGRSGLTAVEEHDPDLVLLDLAMPVMDGFEALPRMRRACPEAKIIVLSGFEIGAMSARAQDLGADGYLQKGASLTSMLGYVRDVLGPALQGPPSPPLVVVPDPDARTEAPPQAAPRTLPAWLGAVPFGVVRLADDPGLTLLETSHATAGLLGVPVQEGEPLDATSTDLADLVQAHRHAEAAQLCLPAPPPAPGAPPGTEAQVTLSRAGDALVLVVTSLPSATGRLRTVVGATGPGRGADLPTDVPVLRRAVSAEMGDREAGPLDDLLRRAVRLDTVTADLLAASLHARGLLRSAPRPCSLPDLFREVALDQEVEVHCDVSGDLSGDLSDVVVDPDHLRLLLDGLVRNAAAYGAPPVALHAELVGTDLRVTVTDRGDGLPLPVAVRLFVDSARTRLAEGGGTGLGLYVVQALAEAHGGRVEHHGGAGATAFTVHLPQPTGH